MSARACDVEYFEVTSAPSRGCTFNQPHGPARARYTESSVHLAISDCSPSRVMFFLTAEAAEDRGEIRRSKQAVGPRLLIISRLLLAGQVTEAPGETGI